jgi:hypothetical protein
MLTAIAVRNWESSEILDQINLAVQVHELRSKGAKGMYSVPLSRCRRVN